MTARKAPKSLDPYATLGVDKSATEKDVRRAYRRRAKDTHPDSGGDADAFAEVSKAHDILSNPIRRLTYDTTGQTDEPGPDNKISAAIGLIAGMVDMIISEETEPTKVNLIAKMDAYLQKLEYETTSKKRELKADEKKIKALSARFRRTTGQNFIKAMLDERSGLTFLAIIELDGELENIKLARSILKEFEFDFERPAPASFYGGQFSMAGV